MKRDRSLADTDLLAHRATARLVAHIRTVREVVGPELAHEELVEKGSLVAGPTRGVEHRLVWIGQRVQVLSDERERGIPLDGEILIRVRVVDHRGA